MRNAKIKKARSRHHRRNERRATRAFSHSADNSTRNLLRDPMGETFYDPRVFPEDQRPKWGRYSPYGE